MIQAGKAGVSGLIVSPYDVKNMKNKLSSIAEMTAEAEEQTEAELTLEHGIELIENNDYKQALQVFDELTSQGEDIGPPHLVDLLLDIGGRDTDDLTDVNLGQGKAFATPLDQQAGDDGKG